MNTSQTVPIKSAIPLLETGRTHEDKFRGSETADNRTSCWSKRSRLEKRLIFFSSFLLILAISLVILTIVRSNQDKLDNLDNLDDDNLHIPSRDNPPSYIPPRDNPSRDNPPRDNPPKDNPPKDNPPKGNPPKDNPSVCNTPGCISAAAGFLKKADLSGDPCSDFYNFACGEFEADNAISENETPFTNAKFDMSIRLKAILEGPPDTNENKAFGKVRTFYDTCKNLAAINILSDKPLKALLQQLGGWPAVEGEKWTSEQEKNFEWAEAIVAMRNIGVPHDFIVDLSVIVNIVNSEAYTIWVDKPTLGMAISRFLLGGINGTYVQEYLRFMINTAVLLGANRDTAESEMTAALEFEVQLANLTLVEEERFNINTFGDLQRKAPMVNWVKFANRLLMDKVDEDERIMALSPNYLEQLTYLLKKTPKRTIANYLMWRVALSVIQLLDDTFRSIWLEFNTAVTGQTSDIPRWYICLESTKGLFGDALGAMYIRRYFNKDARDLAVSLVRDVKDEFLSILNDVDWMDTITMGRTINKVKAMEEMVAYPLELLNDAALEDYYFKTSVTENEYFSSVLQIRRAWTDYSYGKLRQIHNRHDWRNMPSVLEVNAYYSPSMNSIMIPAGVLQGIFFGSDRPRYINYGAIGSLIGHEITHGFDDTGRKFDEVGNLELWGQPATDVQFANKAECMVDQYSEYTMKVAFGMAVNGVLTLSENTADNGGVKAAYGAYKKWETNNYKEDSLPGLNFTPRQLFWISFANVWCMKTTRRNAILTLLGDKHSPAIFRVNGVVSNSPEFSADFKCPVGSPMNPVRKCEVW